MEFLHICLNVSDADRIARWYSENLDFEKSWEFTSDDGQTRHVYVAGPGGTEIQLSDGPSSPSTPGDLWDHLALRVTDVDEAFAEIDHHGVVMEPTDKPAAGARVAFVEDPDGHVVELVEPMD